MNELISGEALKQAAVKFAVALQAKIDGPQKGFFGIFDKWYLRVLGRLHNFDASRSWEDSVQEDMARNPATAGSLAWDFMRLRMFLDRWEQGRFVDYGQREASAEHYAPRTGGEFGGDVFLTTQGAPLLIQWRGLPLMKNAFDFATYPLLLAEIKPQTIFEIGSGAGSSAQWLADHLAVLGIEGHVHSADIKKVESQHPGVSFYQGDCNVPETLFASSLLKSSPRPWLVIEDAHANVEGVLSYFHTHLQTGDYLVVEDSEVKREALRSFTAAHAGQYKVDTRYTDYFGRNATCAGDSIFKRVE